MSRLIHPPESKQEGKREEWSARINNPDPEVRLLEVARLGAAKNERAVPSISLRLSDADVRVRRDAAWALGEIGDAKGIVSAYGRMYRPPQPEVTASAENAVPREKLMDTETSVRQQAAVKAIPALIRSLSDADPGVRVEAARALGRIENSRAIPSLIQSLKDPDYRVRRDSIESMLRIDDGRAVPAIISRLNDPDVEVRLAACEALGELGDSRALPALRRAAENDGVEEVKERAQRAVNRILERMRPVPVIDEEDEDFVG